MPTAATGAWTIGGNRCLFDFVLGVVKELALWCSIHNAGGLSDKLMEVLC